MNEAAAAHFLEGMAKLVQAMGMQSMNDSCRVEGRHPGYIDDHFQTVARDIEYHAQQIRNTL